MKTPTTHPLTRPEAPEEEAQKRLPLPNPLISSIGAAQFILLTLGLMILHIMVKIAPRPDASTPVAHFLLDKGIYLVLIPILWDVFAHLTTRGERALLPAKVVQALGVGIVAGIAVLFTVLLVHWYL